MIRRYNLQPHGPADAALEFEWDPDTGELSGRDAEQVRAFADEAQRDGYWTSHPYPTPYPIEDPLHRPSEMAVILGRSWKLPPDLAAVHPQPPGDDLPPGAIP